jgi:hypothetical protein
VKASEKKPVVAKGEGKRRVSLQSGDEESSSDGRKPAKRAKPAEQSDGMFDDVHFGYYVLISDVTRSQNLMLKQIIRLNPLQGAPKTIRYV